MNYINTCLALIFEQIVYIVHSWIKTELDEIMKQQFYLQKEV